MSVELDLLGDHRFGFDDQTGVRPGEDLSDYPVGLFGIGRKMHRSAKLGYLVREMRQQSIEMTEGMKPYRLGSVAELIHDRELGHNTISRLGEVPYSLDNSSGFLTPE
jgi:hypothetical protein